MSIGGVLVTEGAFPLDSIGCAPEFGMCMYNNASSNTSSCNILCGLNLPDGRCTGQV